MTCESDTKEPYTFAFRIPGWCASYEKEIPKGAEVEEKDGHLYVKKYGRRGDDPPELPDGNPVFGIQSAGHEDAYQMLLP